MNKSKKMNLMKKHFISFEKPWTVYMHILVYEINLCMDALIQ